MSEKYEPKFKDLKFQSREFFELWLKELTKYRIEFEDEGQDFLEWWLDERGEVLNSDLQAFVWNGTMVDVDKMTVGRYLPLRNGSCIQHIVKSITYIGEKNES